MRSKYSPCSFRNIHNVLIAARPSTQFRFSGTIFSKWVAWRRARKERQKAGKASPGTDQSSPQEVTRPPRTLGTLPPEMILNIFKSADNFSDIAALAQTAHVFNDVWKQNPNSICEAVIPRAITNLPAAEDLRELQEEFEGGGSSQDGSYSTSVTRARRLLSNARRTSAAAAYWMHLPPHPGFEAHVRDAVDLEQALYRVWTVGYIATQGNIRLGREFLEKLNHQEHRWIWEVWTNQFEWKRILFGPWLDSGISTDCIISCMSLWCRDIEHKFPGWCPFYIRLQGGLQVIQTNSHSLDACRDMDALARLYYHF